MAEVAAENTIPKLFISYSWTSEDHKQWVLDLATGLRENGVDVILDRWHLLEGQDTHAFMERMVNDPDVKHVALICDRKYVEKANARDGGVGVEAQIITPSIYASHQQTKFVALVTEQDENEKPFFPTYYGAKKWIGFLDPSTYTDNFETLLRWVFDKPLDKPPPLGRRPAFITEANHSLKLATSSHHRRVIDAIKGAKPNALPSLVEYFERVVEEFENLRIKNDSQNKTPFDELMIASIDGFIPYRNELISTFVVVATYTNEPAFWETIHRFFEHLIPYQERPESVNAWNETDFDNFCFIIYELFLYLIAAFPKFEKFDGASYFMSTKYFLGKSTRSSPERMKSFEVFETPIRSFDIRRHRLSLNVWNMHAALLKERAGGQPVDFEFIKAADFILHFRSRVDSPDGFYWYPYTFVFIDYYQPALEMFARADSRRYLTRLLPLLGINDLDTLKRKAQELDSDQRKPKAHFHSLNASSVMNIDKLGSSP